MAKDVFVVANDRGPKDLWVVYVVENNLPVASNFDPRATGVQIFLEVPVEVQQGGEGHLRELIQAIARLDAQTGSDCNRRALAEVFRMGMLAQQELDKKGLVLSNADVANGGR